MIPMLLQNTIGVVRVMSSLKKLENHVGVDGTQQSQNDDLKVIKFLFELQINFIF